MLLLPRRSILGAAGLLAMPAIIRNASAACSCSGGGGGGGGTTTAPPQAQAVGYTLRTLGPNVTLGTNWFVVPGQRIFQNADGTVTDPGPGSAPWHFNAHMDTTQPDGNNNMRGSCFGGGGYFEIEMSIANPNNITQNADGWPAWWSEAMEGGFSDFPNTLPFNQHAEVDFAEFLGSRNYNGAGIIHWSDAQTPFAWSYTTGAVGIDTTVNTVNIPIQNRQKYGWLWVPHTSTAGGYTKQYLNNVQVGPTITWPTGWTSGNKAGDPGDPPWGVLDFHHRHIMVGTSNNNPMVIYTASVWQATDANNIRRGVALPSQP